MDGDFTASLGSLLQWLINPTHNCRQGRTLWYIAFTVHSSQRKAVKNVISSNLNVTHLLVQCCVYYITSRPKEGFCLPQCGNVYNTSYICSPPRQTLLIQFVFQSWKLPVFPFFQCFWLREKQQLAVTQNPVLGAHGCTVFSDLTGILHGKFPLARV